jgi:glycosyltransferase involved in cell wall biosynthesis
MTFRLAYLVTHPIQYQAPLLRAVAADPDIILKVFFGSDFSVQKFVDPGFGQAIEWDVPLLEGYAHEMLPARSAALAPGELPGFWRPFNRGLATALAAGRFQALWVHGYNRAYHWAAIAAAKRLGLKVLLRDEATGVSAARGPVKQMLKSAFFRLLDRGVDAYLAIGRLNRDYYRGFGVAESKIFPMPYAVDNAFFQARIAEAVPEREIFRARLGLKADRPIILFAGKLIERKRPLDLLDAYARIVEEPAARAPYLLFAGDGELKPELTRRIAAAKLEGVRLLGFQSQVQLAALYDLADLFVLPSERESWGLVVNEAMNAGRAVIVNDRIGAGADLVIGGENGFIYPVGDVEALATCLRSALRDPERLAAMGRRSRAVIDGWSFREDVAGLKQALAAIGPGSGR